VNNPPTVALWLNIPEDCQMRGDFEPSSEIEPDIRVVLGDSADDTQLLFEREALERFVKLGQELLAVPRSADRTPRTVLVCGQDQEIRAID
jgi:hypothetical protein